MMASAHSPCCGRYATPSSSAVGIWRRPEPARSTSQSSTCRPKSQDGRQRQLKVDARFMNSSLGFMTHSIAAQAVTVDRSIADKFPEGVLVVVVDERGELLETNAECPRREEVLLWNFSQPGLRWDEMKGTWHVAMAVLTKIFRTPDPTI